MRTKLLTVAGLIGVGVAGRLLPHLPNTTPITAVTLAARQQLGGAWTFAVPLAAMLASDLFIGFYDWKILLSVYGSFMLIAAMSGVMKKYSNPLAVAALAAASSVLFFLITNFAVWLFSPWYAKTLAGLLYCYTLGLPFLRNMLIGDLVYTLVLFSAMGTVCRLRLWGSARPNTSAFFGPAGQIRLFRRRAPRGRSF